MLETLEVSPMKLPDPWRTRGQVRLARVLIIALLVAAPGLYGWTEYEAGPPGEAAELPRTRLRLTPLGPDAKRRMRRRLQVRINRADTRQLRRLPGVGPVLAKRIVRARRQHGPFHELEALTRVTGIGPVTVERLRSRARVSDTMQIVSAARGTPSFRRGPKEPSAPVRLNAADTDRLEGLPGIGPVLAGRILRRRRRHGPFERLEELEAIRGIGPVTVRRLDPRVRVEP